MLINGFLSGSVLKKATSLSIPLAALKFSPITSISYSTTRSKDWDDIVTTHSEDSFARSWTMSGKRLGKHIFSFAADPSAKGKDKGTDGIAKVVYFSFFPMNPNTGYRPSVLQLAVILQLRVHQ